MRVKMIYTLPGNLGGELIDLLNWPDLTTLEETQPHVVAYLDQKYGQGQYTLIRVEAA